MDRKKVLKLLFELSQENCTKEYIIELLLKDIYVISECEVESFARRYEQEFKQDFKTDATKCDIEKTLKLCLKNVLRKFD